MVTIKAYLSRRCEEITAESAQAHIDFGGQAFTVCGGNRNPIWNRRSFIRKEVRDCIKFLQCNWRAKGDLILFLIICLKFRVFKQIFPVIENLWCVHKRYAIKASAENTVIFEAVRQEYIGIERAYLFRNISQYVFGGKRRHPRDIIHDDIIRILLTRAMIF